jgi:hypothetical protein
MAPGHLSQKERLQLSQAVNEALSALSCVPSSVTVKKRRPEKIDLIPSSGQARHSETVALKTEFLDAKDVKIVDIDGETKIGFAAGFEGEGYGALKNSANGNRGLTLPDVTYSQVIGGSISFVLDGIEYGGRFPRGINLGATANVEGKTLSDVEAVYLSGPATIGLRYVQGDPAWGELIYDNTTKTIGDLGCAMTCVAMVLKAYGADVDPGTLNTWMKDNLGFSGSGRVSYVTTLSGYPGSPITLDGASGEGLQLGGDGKRNVPPTSLPVLSGMDATLAAGFPVIAQVLNPDTNNNHWVIVTEKTSTGDYLILDPNGKPRVKLNDTYKTVYRYMTISGFTR